jgi:methyl-accepting chemotaxis protein
LKYKFQRRLLQEISYYAIVFFFLGIFLYFNVTKRALLIVSAAKKFTSGDVSIRANDDGNDELSCISKAFNSMVEEVLSKQRALSLSEEKYRQLFNSIRDAFVRVSMDDKIMECNLSFTNIFRHL